LTEEFNLPEAEQEVYQAPNPRPQRSNSVRRLTEGALMVALSVVLGVLANYMPILNMIFLMIWPIPTTYLIKKHGVPFGLLAFVCSGLLLCLFMGVINAFFVILEMGAVGIWYGVALRREMKPLTTLFGGVVLAGASMVAVAMASLWLAGTTFTDIILYFEQYMTETLKMMGENGMMNTMLAEGVSMEQYMQDLMTMMRELFPSILIISAMIEAWICYVLTAGVLRRAGFAIKTLPKFREWHLPWMALWGISIALFAYIGFHFLHIEWMKLLAFNVLYIYGMLLATMGVALVVWMFKERRTVWVIWILMVLVLFALSAAMWVMIFVGLADCVMDIRAQVRAATKEKDKKERKRQGSSLNARDIFDDDRYGEGFYDETKAVDEEWEEAKQADQTKQSRQRSWVDEIFDDERYKEGYYDSLEAEEQETPAEDKKEDNELF